jgi:hypothetical protein
VSKKTFALALFLLALAVAAFALPPQCDCVYCTTHPSSSCTLVPGNTVTTCGAYYPTHCEGPSGPTAAAVPSRDAFLASLATPPQPVSTSGALPPVCTAGCPPSSPCTCPPGTIRAGRTTICGTWRTFCSP